MKCDAMSLSVIVSLFVATAPSLAAEPSVANMPPVVVKTTPQAGDTKVDPAIKEIQVTFSKPMTDGNWSWVQMSKQSFPETTEQPHYLTDKRTCVLPVKLAPGRTYVLWINSDKFNNFMDTEGQRAIPYLLVFETAAAGVASGRQGDEANDSGEIGGVIERFFQSTAKRDSKGVIETLHTAAIMVEAGGPSAEVTVVDPSQPEKLLSPEGNRDFEGVTITDVKAKTSPAAPSVAIASLTLKLPVFEQMIQRTRANPPSPEMLAQMSPEQRKVFDRILQGDAPPLTMFALMAKRGGQWKIVAMTFPK